METKPSARAVKEETKQKVSSYLTELSDLKIKYEATKREVTQMLAFLSDIETRVEVLRRGVTRPFWKRALRPIFSERSFENEVDGLKGVRKKEGEEEIQNGDVVWVTYRCTDGEKILHEDSGFPIRVGSHTALIEDDLRGVKAGSKPFEVKKKYPASYPVNPRLAGKEVLFKIQIDKVKTKIRREDVNAGN
jgi:hypothetical protein